MFDKNTVYIIGDSKTNVNNPITHNYGQFFLGLVVDTRTDVILDCTCTAVASLTEQFVKSIFVGKTLSKFDNEVEDEIKLRYFGSSQKAIIVAYKDAVKNYIQIKQRHYS